MLDFQKTWREQKFPLDFSGVTPETDRPAWGLEGLPAQSPYWLSLRDPGGHLGETNVHSEGSQQRMLLTRELANRGAVYNTENEVMCHREKLSTQQDCHRDKELKAIPTSAISATQPGMS